MLPAVTERVIPGSRVFIVDGKVRCECNTVNLPFPFSSKRRKGRRVGGGVETNKERRQRTPAIVALVSEGFSSEADPARSGRV